MAEKKDSRASNPDEEKKGLKKTRTRSPNYPVISFPNALERAREFYEEYGRATVPIVVAHEPWGYKRYSAYMKQVVAALKSFSLLDVTGIADKRELSISNEAYRILENAPDREKIINRLVLKPQIYSELWEKYKKEGIPSDSTLKVHLEWGGYNFNKKVIDSFIKDFKDSMALANFQSDDIIDEQNDQGEEDMGHEVPITPPSKDERSAQINTNKSFVTDSIIGSLKIYYPMNKKKLEIIQKFIAAEEEEFQSYIDTPEEQEKDNE